MSSNIRPWKLEIFLFMSGTFANPEILFYWLNSGRYCLNLSFMVLGEIMNSNIRLGGRELMYAYDVLIPPNAQCEIDLVIGPEYTRNPTKLQLVLAFENGGEGQNVTFKPMGSSL